MAHRTRAPNVPKKRAIFEAARRVRLNYNRLSPQNLGMVRTNWYWLLFRLFGYKHDTAAEIAVFDRFISSFSTDDSAVWCNHANSTSPLEYAPKEQYGDGVWMKFEGIPVRVPAQYDAYLTQNTETGEAEYRRISSMGIITM